MKLEETTHPLEAAQTVEASLRVAYELSIGQSNPALSHVLLQLIGDAAKIRQTIEAVM